MDDSTESKGKEISFELSPEDLKAIARGAAVQVPSSAFFGKTLFTIENAPIPKSVHDKVTIQLHIEKSK